MYTIATLIPTYPSVGDMITFSLMGFGVVLFVLAMLSMITSTVGLFFKEKKKAAEKNVEVKQAAAKQVPQDHEFVISAAVAAVMPELQKDNAELLAVLTAAAATVLEEEHVVVSFKEVVPDMSYARQGRQQIYASKNYIPRR